MVVFSDPHESAAVGYIAEFARQHNLESICLGDLLVSYETSEKGGFSSAQFRQELANPKSGLRRGIEQGNYTPKQIEKLTKEFKKEKKSRLQNAGEKYKKIAGLFDGRLSTIGGNWDLKEELEEAFGKNYHNGTVSSLNGLNIAWCSGGGSIPPPALGLEDLLLSDNSGQMMDRSSSWKRNLLTKDDIDIIATHVPDHSPHEDLSARGLQAQILARKRKKMKDILLEMYGHLHGPAKLEFSEIKDEDNPKIKVPILRFTPGTSAFKHNDGSYASFTVAEFGDDNKLRKVEEYQIRPVSGDELETILANEYTIDWEKRNVQKKALDRHLEIAKITPLQEKVKLDLKYERLNTEKLDQKISKNFRSLEEIIELRREIVKRTLDSVRNKYLDPKIKNRKLTPAAQDEAAEKVIEKLSEESARILGIKKRKKRDKEEESIWKEILLHEIFGLKSDEIRDELYVPKSKMGSFPYDWGRGLIKASLGQRKTSNLIAMILRGVFRKQLSELVDIYTPTNLQRSEELKREEALPLLLEAYSKGLLESGPLEQTGKYKTVKASGKKYNIAELLKEFDLQKTTPEDLQKDNLKSREFVDGLQSDIDSGNTAVMRDKKGDYLLGPNGKVYLPEETKQNLRYQPRSLEEELKENGTKPLIRDGDKYYLPSNQGNYITIKQEDETFDLTSYSITKEQHQQQIKAAEEAQREQIARQGVLDSQREEQGSAAKPVRKVI